MAAAAANTDGPEKSIAEVQHIVENPVASASVEEDTLFGDNLHLPSKPDPAASAATDNDERSEAEVRLDAAEKVILRSDPSIPGSLTWVSDGKYLSAVDEIIRLSCGGVDGDVHGRATSLIETAMSRLRKEFRHIIVVHSANPDVGVPSANLHADYRSFQSPSVSIPSEITELTTEDFSTSMEEEQHEAEERGWYSLSDDQRSNLIPFEVISDLKEIAYRMIAAGYQQELCEAYSSACQDLLNNFFYVRGVDQLSIEHAQTMEFEILSSEARQWIRKLKFLVTVVLPWERELSDRIFEASDELREESFRRATKCFVLQQFNLGAVIATRLQSPRGVFRMLDIYEALSDLQALFLGNSEEFICGEVEEIVERLGKMVRETLAEFEVAIRSTKLSNPGPSGQIHPMARYVMNYIMLLVTYSSSLNLLLHDDGGDDSVCDESMTPLGQRMHLFISHLECRIQEMLKFYEGDDALKNIILMNNILYMVHKIEASELEALLGDWVCTHHGQIQQHATSYLRASWSKPLSYLKIDGLLGEGDSSSVSRVALKRRLKNFNSAFEEIWSTQTSWIVPDPELRKDLRLLILMTVIPGYQSFVGRFQPLLEGAQQPSKYIKYAPEDLENYLSDLFEGIPKTPNHLRRKLRRFQPLLEGGQQPLKYIKYTPEDLEIYLSDLFEGIPRRQSI